MKNLVIVIFFTYSNVFAAAGECHQSLREFMHHTGPSKKELIIKACSSPTSNPIKTMAMQKYLSVNFAVNYAVTTVGFTWVNWDKPKDMVWFERLGFNLVFTYLVERMIGKFLNISRIQDEEMKKVFAEFLLFRGAVGSLILLSDKLFGPDYIQQLKKSPHFESDMKKLEKYADEYLLKMEGKSILALSMLDHFSLNLGTHYGVNFDHLTPNDLNNSDIRNLVLAAMTKAVYEESHHGLIQTGNANEDFFVADTVYSTMKIPMDLFFGLIVNRSICANLDQPEVGLVKAVGLSIVYQSLFTNFYGVLYQRFKKSLINKR